MCEEIDTLLLNDKKTQLQEELKVLNRKLTAANKARSKQDYAELRQNLLGAYFSHGSVNSLTIRLFKIIKITSYTTYATVFYKDISMNSYIQPRFGDSTFTISSQEIVANKIRNTLGSQISEGAV